MKHDLEQIIKYQDYDKHYKETLEELDRVRLEDSIEEAIQ